MHPKMTQVYDQGPAPKKLVLFAVFYIQDRAKDSFETQQWNIMRRNKMDRHE